MASIQFVPSDVERTVDAGVEAQRASPLARHRIPVPFFLRGGSTVVHTPGV
jgi:hypothetical protein